MPLAIFSLAAALAGLIAGLVKRRRSWIILSILALILIGILWGIYAYLYSLNPY